MPTNLHPTQYTTNAPPTTTLILQLIFIASFSITFRLIHFPMNIIKNLYQRFKKNFYWSEWLVSWLVIAIAAWFLLAAIVAPAWVLKCILVGIFLTPTIMAIVEFVKVLMGK